MPCVAADIWRVTQIICADLQYKQHAKYIERENFAQWEGKIIRNFEEFAGEYRGTVERVKEWRGAIAGNDQRRIGKNK